MPKQHERARAVPDRRSRHGDRSTTVFDASTTGRLNV
jgi:hypothetical protein